MAANTKNNSKSKSATKSKNNNVSKKTKAKNKNLANVILGMNVKGKPRKGIKRLRKIVYHYYLPKKNLTLFFALASSRLLTNVFETIRRVIRRKVPKKKSFVKLCRYPSILITKKPKEMRMGKGKGPVKALALCIWEGFALIEVQKLYIPLETIFAYKGASKKLSFKTEIGSL